MQFKLAQTLSVATFVAAAFSAPTAFAAEKIVKIDGSSTVFPITEAVAPSEENVRNGSYQPLSRPLFIYVNAASAEVPEVKSFIDYYLENSTELIQEVKFVPLPENEVAAVIKHWQDRKTGTGFGGEPEIGVKIEDLLKRI